MEKDHSDDAFGHALMACLLEEDNFYCVERDDNFLTVTDLRQFFSDITNPLSTPLEESKSMDLDLEALGNFVRGTRVLDVGAGAGRHSLYAQNQGAEVTAVDYSPLAVEVCNRRGVTDARNIRIEDSANAFLNQPKFDVVLLMGHNLGLLGRVDKAKQILAQLSQITSEKAKIIGTGLDPYKTDDPIHLEYHEHNRQLGRMPGQIKRRHRFKNLISSWFDSLLISEEELRNILSGTDWHIEQMRWDEKKSAYQAVLSK